MATNTITEAELGKSTEILRNIQGYYYGRMVGQKQLGMSLLVAIMCNGHILLESVPGLAKTTAAKTMTEAVCGSFSRIQCTPDLLPSDIIGSQIFNYSTNSFDTKIGPVYANFVLLDEINRSSAKTQSAMLEVMQEYQTTIGGEVFKMPEIFTVIATQNPIEQEGTYLLSEAQSDRFLIKEVITYPSVEEECMILDRIEADAFKKGEGVATINDLLFLQDVTKRVYISDAVKRYIVSIIDATRHLDRVLGPNVAQYVDLGSSTRGAIALMDTSKAVAVMSGRNYVTPDDVRRMLYSVLRHRISLNFSAVADGIAVERIISDIAGAVPTP